MLKVNQLTKKFGTFTALHGVNFEVGKGEVFGFIGPNGAGKSTTIRVLLGLIQSTSGDATIFGKNVWTEAVEIHKRLAYVPGDVHLWPNLTGGEVIDLFGKLQGGMNREKRDELIARFDLDPTKKCKTYSKGNRQKIALVSAFASEADLFILDEPTSGLDPLMEHIFQESVLELKQQGKSVLLSSHILSEVEKLCDRIGIIRQGEIIESGTMEELRHLTRTNFRVETKEPILTLETLNGIHQIEKQGDTLSFQVDSKHIDEVIRHISQFGVLKIESTPPTLEDLFMQHYETKSTTHHGGRSV